jgi:LacI family transcriptional regulator
MACNDDMGRLITELCRTQNILVPDEIAILGVDNDEEVCNSANPPMSSIAMATEKAGYEAATLLASLMQQSNPCARTVIVQPSHVVPRRSTDMLAIEDPVLAKALRFIRDQSGNNISVVDVMDSCGLSRRALQDRFQQRLGRTPMEEIHRCRVARVARLLVETHMTVREIAGITGFELDAHVARFFSRHTGMTPLEYRRRKQLPSEMSITGQARK